MNMLKGILNNLPGPSFLVTNTLIWIGFNSMSSFMAFQRRIDKGHEVEYVEVWLNYLPWWGHWIWIAPLVAACIASMPYRRNKSWQLVQLNLLLFLLTMTVYWLCSTITVSLVEYGDISMERITGTFKFIFSSPFYFDLLIYASVVCVGFVRSFDARMMQEEIRNKELAHQLVQTELDSLKSQLNPHFLFNTLNSIASLIRQDSKQFALTALSDLSQMLRKVLEHQNSQMITLTQELE